MNANIVISKAAIVVASGYPDSVLEDAGGNPYA